MLRNNLNIIIVTIIFYTAAVNKCISQIIVDDKRSKLSTLETFQSKSGTILKLKDYKLSYLKTTFGAVETKIRVGFYGETKVYFYIISKQTTSGESEASVEYSDFIEMVKAFNTLKNEFEIDYKDKADYLENKYKSKDDISVGYYFSGSKMGWFIQLDKYSSSSAIFIPKAEYIEANFNEAKEKFESLMSLENKQ